ncbi:putative GABA permease [Xylaria cf. heliscus]|nr:putative GABA permease [Xylaria cf. heliscus]
MPTIPPDISSVTSRQPGHLSHDDAALERLGKKPVLKRNFGFLSILGFSCTVLITWEGSLITFLSGLQNGGPSGIIYGFLTVWIGTLSVFATLSELASMAPTSGGQYHWVSMLAPPSVQKPLSYMTGWLTITGWQSLVASGGYVTGTMIQGLILLTYPEYAENIFEGFILVIHIVGFFAVIFPLALLSRHGTATDVFENFSNMGGWPTQGLSFSIGIMGNVFAFLGGDGAIYVRNAAVVMPRSLMTGLTINGTLGLALLIAVLFSIGDIDQALAENPQYPFMAIFRHAVGSTAGAAAMLAIVVVMSLSATTGCIASTLRLYWSFSRDRALPGWRFLKQINPRTHIPRYAVLLTTFIGIVLSSVNIGDKTAFNGVISISIAGLFSSYLIAALLLLYRRLTGRIQTSERIIQREDDTLVDTNGLVLTWGPWQLRGAFGICNNIFTCVYLTYIFFFSFWPSGHDVSAATFNYAVLVFGAVVLFSLMYYIVRAKHVYTGPVVEVSH